NRRPAGCAAQVGGRVPDRLAGGAGRRSSLARAVFPLGNRLPPAAAPWFRGPGETGLVAHIQGTRPPWDRRLALLGGGRARAAAVRSGRAPRPSASELELGSEKAGTGWWVAVLPRAAHQRAAVPLRDAVRQAAHGQR